MKIVQFSKLGIPHEVCECVTVADPDRPAKDEILVRLAASPINPADVLNITGRYASKPTLPARAGNEGVGRVHAVGSGVETVVIGDLVMLPARENWVEQRLVPAGAAIKLPAEGDTLQMSLLRISPPTAWLLLNEIVELSQGDWLIQNAANSGVGKLIIRMAREKGVRTINVVRRDGVAPTLQSLGADLVIPDGDDLTERVRAKIGDDRLPLAVDAVSGEGSMRLARCLSVGGALVNYGVLSGERVIIDYHELVFRSITVRGFWLSKELERIGRAETVALYQRLADRLAAGEWQTEIEATYALSDARRALEHACRDGRRGKIVFTMDG